MTTIIYAADIKKMNLNEDEKRIIKDWAEQYKYDDEFKSIQYYFERGTADAPAHFKSTWNKFLVYYVKKFLNGNSQGSLREFCNFMSMTFCVWNQEVMRSIKGLAAINSQIYIADTFGLDVLGYNK